MYIFGFIFFLLALLSPSLPLPLSTYRPGEVTNSSTTPGTTIMHGRCGVHITHRMTGVWDPVLALQGSITGYILDANHTEIGKLSKRYYNIRHQVVEFHSRLDDVLCIAPGGTVQFELGGHSWNSTDGRCSVGNWKRYEFWGNKWAYPRRDMDCGFAC